jgi:uncharacterized protein (DUF302 family)
MLKNLLASIGGLVVVAMIFGGVMLGSKLSKLDSGAMPAYIAMFSSVLEYGDPARAMMKEFTVEEDVSNEDVGESINALAEEYNMRITGDIKMFTNDDARGTEVKHARIFSLCSLHIAKIFLNHSRSFGGFMPCRIILIEYGDGSRKLITMDLTLAISGGYTLPPKMSELANQVKVAMEEIPARAAKGDF